MQLAACKRTVTMQFAGSKLDVKDCCGKSGMRWYIVFAPESVHSLWNWYFCARFTVVHTNKFTAMTATFERRTFLAATLCKTDYRLRILVVFCVFYIFWSRQPSKIASAVNVSR